MTTKEELERKFEEIYYFELTDENPLLLREPGQTIRLGNKHIAIEATGQVELNDKNYGFLAGGEATK